MAVKIKISTFMLVERDTSRAAVPIKSPLSFSNIPAGNSKIRFPTGTLALHMHECLSEFGRK